MADLSIKAGSTSQSILVDLYILATGAPQTALVYNSTSLTACYSFVGANSGPTSISLATQTTGTAWSSGGFVKLSDTQMPGVYNFDVPDAVLAASKGREVWVTFTGFAGMATRTIKIELTGWDNQVAIPTTAQIATGVWTDTTAGDFTTSLSVGKSIMNGVTLGTGLTVAAVTGLTASNLDTTISSRMATYTQPTGFLAATFPTGTVANTTNITAGTITTASNLTTNNDKTGYALTVTPPTAAQVRTEMDSNSTQLAKLGSPAGASLSADVAAVKVDTAAAKASTAGLTFTVTGKVDSNAKSMNDVTIIGTGVSTDLWRA